MLSNLTKHSQVTEEPGYECKSYSFTCCPLPSPHLSLYMKRNRGRDRACEDLPGSLFSVRLSV